MTVYVLIDNEELQVIKLHKDPAVLLYWAELEIPNSDYRICETTPDDYRVYTELELRWIYYHTMDCLAPKKHDGTYDYEKLLRDVELAIDTIAVNTATREFLEHKLGHELKVEDMLSV